MMRITVTLALLCSAIAFGVAIPINEANPEINPDLFEGDILGVKPGEQPRNAIIDNTLLWPFGQVYYVINATLTNLEMATLYNAFSQYESKSCLKFIERTTQTNYISIEKTGGGCYSYIGMIGGEQQLSLDPSCYRNGEPGTVIHEFLHAVGFFHEQSRPDRDDYVIINYDNIQPGKEGNFNKYGYDVVQTLGATYDYGSVLHYGAYGFAIDPSVPTIIVPEGVSIGQRVGFSDIDLQKLNTLYRCSQRDQ